MSDWKPGRGAWGYPNPCPVCLVRPFARCRTLSTGRVTDTHARRVNGEWPDVWPPEGGVAR